VDLGESVVVERGDLAPVEDVRAVGRRVEAPIRFINVDFPEPEGPMIAM
jgi:hypothetical protein